MLRAVLQGKIAALAAALMLDGRVLCSTATRNACARMLKVCAVFPRHDISYIVNC